MDDDLFNLFWKAVAAILCTLIVSAAGCTAFNTKVRTDAVVAMQNKGANPIDAMCAIEATTDNRASYACVLRAVTPSTK